MQHATLAANEIFEKERGMPTIQRVPYRILAPDGTISDKELAKNLFGKDALMRIYQCMVKTRILHEWGTREGHGLAKPNEKRMTLFIGPKGQEAVVASVFAMGKEVWLYPYGRSWHVALARDVRPKSIFDGFFGNPSAGAIDDFHSHRCRLPYVVVGAQLPHAVGAAWAPKLLANKIVPSAAYFGDGATAQGDFHGAMSHAKIHKVPTIFFCENNQWAISVPLSLTSPTKTIADRAKGYDMAAVRVDGNDVFSCFLAAKLAYERAVQESEPSLVEFETYRLGEHTTAVGQIVEIPAEELARAEHQEPLRRMKLFLLSEDAGELFGIEWDEDKDQELQEKFLQEIKMAADTSYGEFLEAKKSGRALVKKSFGWLETPRVGELYKKLSQSGAKMKNLAHESGNDNDGIAARDAIGIAAFDAMLADPTVVWIGQDVGRAGGVMRTSSVPKSFAEAEPAVRRILPDFKKHLLHGYLPLQTLFPARIVDMHLNESFIAGCAFGLSLGNGEKERARPIAEVQFSGFGRFMLHHIEEHSRHHYRTMTKDAAPGVYLFPSGTGERIEFHRDVELPPFTNNPALIVVFPRDPQDYYDMFFAALASDKPVVFFWHIDLQRFPKIKKLVRRPPSMPIEEFGPRKIADGNSITVVSYGKLVYECEKAFDILRKERRDFSGDLFDLRVIKPLNRLEAIIESVKKTGRFLYVQEEPLSFGSGAELVRRICREAHFYNETPPEVLAPRDTFTPPSKFWDDYIPQPEDIAEKISEIIRFK